MQRVIKKYPPILLLILSSFLLFLPFQVWDFIALPAQYGKILFAGWAGLILFIFWLIRVLLKKSLTYIRLVPIDIILIIYSLFLLLHLFIIQAVNIDVLYILKIFSLIPVYLITRIISKKHLHYLFEILLISAIGEAIWGILQYTGVLHSLHSDFAVTGTFFNPGPYSGYLAAIAPVAFAFLLPSFQSIIAFNNPKSKLFSGLICILVIVTVLSIVQSRAALISVLFSTSYLFLYANRKSLKNINIHPLLKTGFILLFLFIGIGCAIGLYKLKKDSADGRLFIWQNTLEMIKGHPVSGTGINTFQSSYMHYQAAWFKSHPESAKSILADNTVFAFNEPLRIVSEQGLSGLILIVFILVLAFYRNNGGTIAILARACIVGIVVFGFFSYPFAILPIQMVFVVSIAIIASTQKTVVEYSILQPQAKLKFFSKAVITGLMVITSIFFSQKLYTTTIACKNWKQAINTFNPKKENKSLNYCSKAYPLLKNNGFFIAMYGGMLTKRGEYKKAIPVLNHASTIQANTKVYLDLGNCHKKLGAYKKAEKAFKYALQMIPSRIKPIYELAILYNKTGRNEEAIEIIDSYMKRKNKKRTIASYEIELELMEMQKNK